MSFWHTKTTAEIFTEYNSSEQGLASTFALDRLKSLGENAFPDAKRKSIFVIFLEQFQSSIIYILLIAAVIVFVMGEIADGFIILAVLIINAIIGAIQEGRAQNALGALKQLATTVATVMRDGREVIVPDKELVVGDVITLKEGDKVPADARIIDLNGLKIDESALTGESEPVLKNVEVLKDETLVTAEQKNMVFKATYVVSGYARAVVVATGVRTVIGAISEKIQTLDTEVPLKADIRSLSKVIIIAVLAVSAFIFVLGLVYGNSPREMFATVVAIAVSAIPEGLPVVVTLILATGVSRMSKRNALVKRLQAVEALGQANVIAVDKTGTITLNQMMVTKVYVDDTLFDVTGNGYEPKGNVLKEGVIVEHVNHPDLMMVGRISSFVAFAKTAFSEEKNQWQRISGDPTDAALLTFSSKIGFIQEALERENPKLFDAPFNSDLKYHAVIHNVSGDAVLSVIGAPESVLARSIHIWRDGKEVPLTKSEKEKLETVLLSMSKEGLRVLGLAHSFKSPKMIENGVLPDLCFVGFVGISDVIRSEARKAVEDAQGAGIRVVMITGDYSETARAIGSKAHIYKDGDVVITGADLETLSESELVSKLAKTTIFARVSPEHKLRIIELYRKKGDVVAMTGDGVNDALSLAAADLGVSMGKVGTEVAKEASDIVLLDDNFGSIIAAVEEGRNIYETIKKVIFYLFSTSLGEILVIVAAIIFGYPLPITASQIIWLNFVTDGFLVVALALEPKESGSLKGRMKKTKRWIVDWPMFRRMMLVSTVMTVGTLYLFSGYVEGGYIKASTMALTAMAVFQWFNAWNCRSEKGSVFSFKIFNNLYLVGATVIVILLQLAALYMPFFQKILRTTPISLSEWVLIIAVSFSIIIADEIRKVFVRLSIKNTKK